MKDGHTNHSAAMFEQIAGVPFESGARVTLENQAACRHRGEVGLWLTVLQQAEMEHPAWPAEVATAIAAQRAALASLVVRPVS